MANDGSTVMCGGEADAFAKAGPAGARQIAKTMNQICLGEASSNGTHLPVTALIGQFCSEVQKIRREQFGYVEPGGVAGEVRLRRHDRQAFSGMVQLEARQTGLRS
jgi:hypothetical protein